VDFMSGDVLACRAPEGCHGEGPKSEPDRERSESGDLRDDSGWTPVRSSRLTCPRGRGEAMFAGSFEVPTSARSRAWPI
jgi:hypothetical protein